MFKKIISTLATISLISTSFSAFWYTNSQLEAANDLAEREVIRDNSGNPSAYNLDSNVLRQEIALISRRVSGLGENSGCKNIFWDVTANTPNTWACKNIEALVDYNLISANPNFRPEDSITKSEALIMFIRSIGFDFTIQNMSNWQEEVVSFAASKWVVENFTDYNTLAKRGWIFEIANFSIEVKEEEIEDWIWEGKKLISDEVM